MASKSLTNERGNVIRDGWTGEQTEPWSDNHTFNTDGDEIQWNFKNTDFQENAS